MKFQEKLYNVYESRRGKYTTIIVFLSHEHVAIVTPVERPRVLHQPISFAVKCAVADSKHWVIELVRTVTWWKSITTPSILTYHDKDIQIQEPCMRIRNIQNLKHIYEKFGVWKGKRITYHTWARSTRRDRRSSKTCEKHR